MSLKRAMALKLGSLAYRIRARRHKRSARWDSTARYSEPDSGHWEVLHRQLADACAARGVPFSRMPIDRGDFERFSESFEPPLLSIYALRCREKKLMEHFVAYTLLSFEPTDRYVDIASENSPFPDLFSRRLGVESYSQDLTYRPGVHGREIGSSADQLPVPDNWIDKASSQCAFEHFHGSADVGFIRELARVLKPGGRCVIVPLYVEAEALNVFDPVLVNDWEDSSTDAGARCVAELGLGAPFKRIYSPATLDRVLIPEIGLRYQIFHLAGHIDAIGDAGPRAVAQVERIRYTLLIEREVESMSLREHGSRRTAVAAPAAP